MRYYLAVIVLLLAVSGCALSANLPKRVADATAVTKDVQSLEAFNAALERQGFECEIRPCQAGCQSDFALTRETSDIEAVPAEQSFCRWDEKPAIFQIVSGSIFGRAYAVDGKIVYISVKDIYTGP